MQMAPPSTPTVPHPRAEPASRSDGPPLAERAGLWLRDRQGLLGGLQWAMVAVYGLLVLGPVLVPALLPAARLAIWGIWWPGVLLSVLVFGRAWCGLFCPEGKLSSVASHHGRSGAIPRWMKWPGWPLALFAAVTVYGQMISVFDHAASALLILGGSTTAAVLVGWLYGRQKRVWCRFLCPVNGVFALLAKLAPVHFRVDARDWDACPPDRMREMRFNCEPMVPVRTMDSASPCHMCGRCAGFRDAVRLELRVPGTEVVAGRGSPWDSAMVIVGLIGVGSGAFWWREEPIAGALRQVLGGAGDGLAPWWLLRQASGAMTLTDGAALLAGIGAVTAVLSLAAALPLHFAARLAGRGVPGFHHLALALVPLAAAGLIAGLLRHTLALLGLGGEAGLTGIVGLGFLASAALSWRIARRAPVSRARKAASAAATALAGLAPLAGWTYVLG